VLNRQGKRKRPPSWKPQNVRDQGVECTTPHDGQGKTLNQTLEKTNETDKNQKEGVEKNVAEQEEGGGRRVRQP